MEDEELAAFDAYCLPEGARAVLAESLGRELEDWIRLICLNESLLDISNWFVMPNGEVASEEDAVFQTVERSNIHPELIVRIEGLEVGNTIELSLDFKVEEPELPSLEHYGLPAGIIGGSMGTRPFSDGQETDYYLNNEAVTVGEYNAWNTALRVARLKQSAQRSQLMHAQARELLPIVVEQLNWHDWLDVSAINEGTSGIANWLPRYSPTVLEITLNGDQARSLLDIDTSIFWSIEEKFYPSPHISR